MLDSLSSTHSFTWLCLCRNAAERAEGDLAAGTCGGAGWGAPHRWACTAARQDRALSRLGAWRHGQHVRFCLLRSRSAFVTADIGGGWQAWPLAAAAACSRFSPAAGLACAGATCLVPPRRCLRGATATVFAAKPGQDRERMQPDHELLTEEMQRAREINREQAIQWTFWAALYAALSVASAANGRYVISVYSAFAACVWAYFAVFYATFYK